MDSPLKKDNALFSSVASVREICAPLLKHFDIDNFKYLKILPDMSRVHLAMNPKWCEFFYANIERYQKKHLTGGHHWKSGSSRLFALGDACIEDAIAHDVGDGIVLSKHNGGCTEMFILTYKWSECSDAKVDLLMRNMDLIETFASYFKDEAKSIIDWATKNPMFFPLWMQAGPLKHFRQMMCCVRTFWQISIS